MVHAATMRPALGPADVAGVLRAALPTSLRSQASRGLARFGGTCLRALSYDQAREDGLADSNKPKEVLMDKRTYQYLVDHTREPEVMASLRLDTADEWPNAKQMQVSPEQGRFLTWLVKATRVKNAIEIGVFTGYSSICIAQGLADGGRLVACECDERPLGLARKAFEDAGVADKIMLCICKGTAALQHLLREPLQEPIDFAFVDADKRGYWDYHELLLKIIRPGGVLVYDNMFWYGAVADPQDKRKTTVALREFHKRLLRDDRVDVTLVAIGDGMALCRRL